MFGRQWSDGLHQAVEAKEGGCKIKEETQTLATITLQNFFKLYKKLARHDRHGHDRGERVLEDLQARRRRRSRRTGRCSASTTRTSIYRTEKEKWNAVVDEIVEVHKTGPADPGRHDASIEKSRSCQRHARAARHQARTCSTPSRARARGRDRRPGRAASSAVTIATNMAGRGTDIILGGNPETLAWDELQARSTPRGSTCPRPNGTTTRRRDRRTEKA